MLTGRDLISRAPVGSDLTGKDLSSTRLASIVLASRDPPGGAAVSRHFAWRLLISSRNFSQFNNCANSIQIYRVKGGSEDEGD